MSLVTVTAKDFLAPEIYKLKKRWEIYGLPKFCGDPELGIPQQQSLACCSYREFHFLKKNLK